MCIRDSLINVLMKTSDRWKKWSRTCSTYDNVWVEFLDYFKSSFYILKDVKVIKNSSTSLKIYREII